MSESNRPASPDDPQPPTPWDAVDPNVPPDPGTPAPAAAHPASAPVPARAPAAAKGKPAPKRRRRRRVPRWLKAVAVVLLLIALLVLFAPTIASTGPARSFVLGKVNQNLNGRVEVANWSLGWTSGLSATGVRVLDAAGQPIAQIGSLTTGLSLLDVIRGNYALGDAVIDGLDFQLRRDADGAFNFAKLAKADPAEPPADPGAPTTAPTPAPPSPEPAKDAPATKLPNVSGRIIVRNSRGSYEDAVSKQSVRFPSIDGDVRVPDINSPIQNTLTVVAVPNGGQQGTLKVSGTADVIEDNEVRVETGNVDETIRVDGLGMATVAAFLPPGTIERLDGVTNAAVTLKLAAGQSGELQAQVTTTGLAAGGPALKGDTFTARELTIVVPPTTIDMSSGFGSDPAKWPVRTGSADKPQAITVTIKHEGYDDAVSLRLTGVTQQSLQNVAANLKPGANGEVQLDARFNLGGLAKQLPHLFPERDGRRLTSGGLELDTLVKLGPDAANITQNLSLADVALTGADGKAEKLQPVEQSLRVSTLGGGWTMPALRDIDLALASGFAHAKFGGKELSQLTGTATGDLAKGQRELGPILPMDGMRLGGTFKVDLTSAGDVTSPTAPIDLALVATLANLQLDGVAGLERFRQAHTLLDARAKVVRGQAGIDALQGLRVVARTGQSERSPTLDAQLSADVKYVASTGVNPDTGRAEPVRVPEVPRYTVDRLNVDLTAAQRDFPAQMAALEGKGLRFDSGALALTGSGSYANDTATFDLKGGINDVDLTRAPAPAAGASAAVAQVPAPPAAPASVLRNYTLALDVAGSHATAGPAAGTRVTRLSITDNQKMLSLRKGDAEIVLPAAKDRRPSGDVVLGADLKKVLDLSRAMGDDPAASNPADGPALESGRVDGTLKLAESPEADKPIALTGRLDVTGINVRTEGEPIRNEKLALTMSVRSAPDFATFNVDHVTVAGRLANGRIHDTVIDTNAGDAPLAAVRKANAVIDLPNLADLHALILAISPPEPPEAVATAKPVGMPRMTPAPAPAPDRTRTPAPAAAGPRGTDVIGRRAPGDARDPLPPQGDGRQPPAGRREGGDPVPTGRERRDEIPAPRDRRDALPPPREQDVAAVAAAADKPAPPGRILGGSANVRLTLGHQGSAVVVTPVITAKALAVGAGDVRKDVGDVNINTAVRLVPASGPQPGDATFLQRLSELTIPSLVLTGVGADVRLEQPMVVKDPAVALASFGSSAATQPAAARRPAPGATLSAILAGRINLAELLTTLEAWNGAKPGTMYPYAGDMTMRQELRTSGGGGTFSLVGRAGVKDFSTLTGAGEKQARFAEPEIAFANNIDLDPGGGVLKINDLSFAMERTGAVRLAASGAIHELDTARRFERLVVNLDYDAEALWDVLRPLMDPETGGKSLEEFTMTGRRQQGIEIAGSYPVNDPKAIRYVKAAGGFALESLAGRGLTVSNLDLRFALDQGVLRLEHVNSPTTAPLAPAPSAAGRARPADERTPSRPADDRSRSRAADDRTASRDADDRTPPRAPTPGRVAPGAICNDSGILSFHGLTVDLNGEHPRLNIPDGHPLIRGVSINPVVADTLIGRFVNPAFNDATQAKGVLDVTVVECRDLALDKAMQSKLPSETGRAELRWSLSDLFLGQPELVGLVAKIKPNALNENGFAGSIRDGRIVIQGGQVYSDMVFNVDKFDLKFDGGIGLAENTLANFNVNLPQSLFDAISDDLGRQVPAEGYRVALTGTTDNWLQNASASLPRIIADLGVRAGLGNVLDRALGGDKRDRRERDRDPRGADAAREPPEGAIGRPRGGENAGDRPAAEPERPDDPLGGLLDRALGGERETDEEKRARRERVRREREEKARRAAEAERQGTPPANAPAAGDEKLSKRERERRREEEKRKAREERERDRR